MILINKQDVIDGLMEDVTSYGLMDDEGNIESGCKDKDVIAMVESLQSVEAIPIEWIEKYAGLLSTIDRTFCKIQAIQIRVMLNDWYVEQANQKREQGKQNEKT